MWHGNAITPTTARVILGGNDADPTPAGDQTLILFGNVITEDTPDDAVLLVEGNPMPASDLRLILAGEPPAGGPYMLGGTIVAAGEQEQ